MTLIFLKVESMGVSVDNVGTMPYLPYHAVLVYYETEIFIVLF